MNYPLFHYIVFMSNASGGIRGIHDKKDYYEMLLKIVAINILYQ